MCNILVGFHHLKKDLPLFFQKRAGNKYLLCGTSDLLNFHCLVHSAVEECLYYRLHKQFVKQYWYQFWDLPKWIPHNKKFDEQHIYELCYFMWDSYRKISELIYQLWFIWKVWNSLCRIGSDILAKRIRSRLDYFLVKWSWSSWSWSHRTMCTL